MKEGLGADSEEKTLKNWSVPFTHSCTIVPKLLALRSPVCSPHGLWRRSRPLH